MFSIQQKRDIFKAVQKILRETNHPELPALPEEINNPIANPWNEDQDPSNIKRKKTLRTNNMDYWKECISEAFDDAGITATEDQIRIVASWVEGAHDQYGMAHGHDCIPNPISMENEKLKKELKIEQEKIICKECNGIGRIITYGPVHSADTECSKCRGEGRHTR